MLVNKTLLFALSLLVIFVYAGTQQCNNVGAVTLADPEEFAETEEAKTEILHIIFGAIQFVFRLFGLTPQQIKAEQKTCVACEDVKAKNEGNIKYSCQVTCSNLDPTVKCPKQNSRMFLLNFDGQFKPTAQLNQAFVSCEKDSDKKMGVKGCVCLFLLADNRIPVDLTTKLEQTMSEQCSCNGKPVPKIAHAADIIKQTKKVEKVVAPVVKKVIKKAKPVVKKVINNTIGKWFKKAKARKSARKSSKIYRKISRKFARKFARKHSRKYSRKQARKDARIAIRKAMQKAIDNRKRQ